MNLNLILIIHIYLHSKRQNDKPKKPKTEIPEQTDLSNEDSIFQLLTKRQEEISTIEEKKIQVNTTSSFVTHGATSSITADNFNKLIAPDDEEPDIVETQNPTKYVPIDWGLKTKLRILTLTKISGNGLKSCQEASGITR